MFKHLIIALSLLPVLAFASPDKGFEVTIKGMTCGHCIENVQKKVSEIPNTQGVKIVVSQNKAEVDFSGTKLNETQLSELKANIKKAVEDAGYTVTRI